MNPIKKPDWPRPGRDLAVRGERVSRREHHAAARAPAARGGPHPALLVDRVRPAISKGVALAKVFRSRAPVAIPGPLGCAPPAELQLGQVRPDRRRIVGPGEGIASSSGSPRSSNGYLAVTQARDGRIHLLPSSKHDTFSLVWMKALSPPLSTER